MYDIENLHINKKECNIDVQKISIEKIEQFLRSGNKEKCSELLDSFFEDIGNDKLESLMLRLYITMDIFISCRSFTRELNIPNEEFTLRFGSIDDISVKVTTLTSTYNFFLDLLEQCVIWRIKYSHEERNDVIKKAKDYILKNYVCDSLTLKSVAAAVNLSPTYFSSIFKKDVGTNFVDYLTNVRLDKAKELLCCSSMRICEIAYKVGFKDYRYFSQIFKKYTGQTPREFKGNNIST